jgi:hypothetical protein
MADDADPLENIWYLSEKLDIDKAVDQMLRAASEIPEVYLGFDERVLVFSRIAAAVFSFLGMPGPYWRYFRTANRFGLAVGLRFIFRPSDIGAMVRTALQKQGYSGPHLDVRR